MPTEGTPSLRESYRAQVRERTIEVAYSEAVDKGWDKVRVGQVATRVGVSRALLYKEFGDKHGLGEALVLHESERFLVGVQQVLRPVRRAAGGQRRGGGGRRDPRLGRLHADPSGAESPAARHARARGRTRRQARRRPRSASVRCPVLTALRSWSSSPATPSSPGCGAGCPSSASTSSSTRWTRSSGSPSAMSRSRAPIRTPRRGASAPWRCATCVSPDARHRQLR